MELKIKTLSPVFIGSGEEYNGLSYIVDAGKINFYNLHGIMKDMSKEEKDSFIAFMDQYVDKNSRARFTLKQLLKAVFNADTYTGLDTHCMYTLPLADKIDDYNRIRTFISEDNNIYIPGTEIKGAIRTAILYYLLNYRLHDKQSSMFSFSRELFASLRSFIRQNIERELKFFRLRTIENQLEGMAFRTTKSMDARYDLLKCLRIRDSYPIRIDKSLFVSNIAVLNVHRKDWRRNGRIAFSCQICRRNEVFSCQSLVIDYAKLNASALGFSDEQKWILQLEECLPNFFQCCHQFSKRLLEEEMEYFSRRNNILETQLVADNLGLANRDEALEILDHIVQRLRIMKAENTPEKPIIRLGGSQGHFSTTINLILRDLDPSSHNTVIRTIGRRKSPPNQFPRTRRIVLTPDGKYDTLGWVQLSTNSV